MNYKVVKDNLDDCALPLARLIEFSVTQYLRRLMNDKYPELRVRLSMTMCDWDGQPIAVESNASFALPNSLEITGDVISMVKDFIGDINPGFTLKIKMDFENNKNRINQNSDTPRQTIFLPVPAKYSFEDIILSDDVRSKIMDDLSAIEQQDLIFNVWGFGEIEKNPRSILNFYGPPGTGKTMCAHAVAKYLNKPLLALNYADIESKYVGEAAKNLKAAFETATSLDAVVFFDEADSFLGKRIENVTQGADQALNSLRSQLLIYLEEYKGVVLFATNLVTNFDRAFEGRILDHIKFELPDKEARNSIIRKMIPSKLPMKVPIEDLEFDEVAELSDGLSGREIKNAVLTMLLKKAKRNGAESHFVYEDLKDAIKSKKESIMKLKAEETSRLKAKIERKLREKSMENDISESNAKNTDSENNNSETKK